MDAEAAHHSRAGDQALRQTAETYRRAVWDNQDAYVEVWLEKDALAGVLVPGDRAVGRPSDGDAGILQPQLPVRGRQGD